MVGEESPNNDGKDDDQELNPLILFVDAVFIILYVFLFLLITGKTLNLTSFSV